MATGLSTELMVRFLFMSGCEGLFLQREDKCEEHEIKAKYKFCSEIIVEREPKGMADLQHETM